MGNMSYCRFRNTVADLRDCKENMDDDDLSLEEAQARVRLIKLCIEIADDYGDSVEVMQKEIIAARDRQRQGTG